MKKALLGIGGALIGTIALAQANNYPNGSTVDDFTVTDTHGVVHNLNSYAAAGKYVMLDFFFYNCGPCEANAPYYSELYQTYGCNTGDLICISINNGTDSDALTEAFSADFGGQFSHPPAVGSGGGDALTTTFGIPAFPTFCLIGPDRVMINHDIWPLTNMSTFVAAFPVGSGISVANCAVGIHEATTARFTSVYPSPSAGHVTVGMSMPNAGVANIELYDVMGQRVNRFDLGTINTTERSLDLSALADGQYLMKLMVNGTLSDTQRLTIAH